MTARGPLGDVPSCFVESDQIACQFQAALLLFLASQRHRNADCVYLRLSYLASSSTEDNDTSHSNVLIRNDLSAYVKPHATLRRFTTQIEKNLMTSYAYKTNMTHANRAMDRRRPQIGGLRCSHCWLMICVGHHFRGRRDLEDPVTCTRHRDVCAPVIFSPFEKAMIIALLIYYWLIGESFMPGRPQF